MADLVRIVVAPGAHITVQPHPSGLAVLGPLILFGGDTADVTPERAAALYAGRLILDPITGALPPSPEAMEHVSVPTVSYDGGPFLRLDAAFHPHPSWTTSAEIKAPEPGLPPDASAPRALVNYHGADQSLASISANPGQPWPKF